MPESAMIWNLILSGFAGMVIWWIRGVNTKLDEARILVSKTREEIAVNYVTKLANKDIMKSVMERFAKLEEKIDKLMEK